MLRQGNKLYFIVLLLLFFVSCNKYKKYNSKEIDNIRNNSIKMAQSIIGANEYKRIHTNMIDSINVWANNELGYYKYYNRTKNYLIDSVICLNKNGDKCITTILLRQLLKTGVQDDIEFFYGVKINERWYFFPGLTMVLPRENYQKDVHTPLSFEKLKQIATWNIYRGYLKQNQLGKWEINEEFFSDLTSVAWCTNCNTQEQWNEAYLRQVRENWQKKE